MPPKSTAKPGSKTTKPTSKPGAKPASRPSKPKESTASKGKEAVPGKKREAEVEPDESAQPRSKRARPSSSTAKAAEAEKKAEAPASAPPSSGGKGILKLGDKLPKMTLQDDDGNEIDVGALAGEKGLVVFLYPRADTPGCTNQACGYRDVNDEIQKLGYDIWGLSKDKAPAQHRWIGKYKLNYKLLCDPDSKLIKRLGAFVQPNNTKRSHYVFEKGSGKLVDIQIGVKPKDDPGNTLAFLKKHHK